MERIGERLIWYYVPFTDIGIPGGGINALTVLNTVFVIGILWTLMWLAVRRLARVPGRGQGYMD